MIDLSELEKAVDEATKKRYLFELQLKSLPLENKMLRMTLMTRLSCIDYGELTPFGKFVAENTAKCFYER